MLQVFVADGGLRSSYQRMPACVGTSSTSTVWFTTSASWSPRFRYASRYISRSEIASSLAAGPRCGMQFRLGSLKLQPVISIVNGAVARTVGPVNVELAVVAQSTWNLKTLRQ